MRTLSVGVVFCASLVGLGMQQGVAQTRHPITFEDFIELDPVSDPQVSPDGRWVAFTVTDYSLRENRGDSDIWILSTSGGQARRLSRSPKGDSQPRWSPDGTRLAFVSSRSGTPQIYLIDPSGGEAVQLATLSAGISHLTWSPDGKWLVFSGDVPWPPSSPGESQEDPYPTEALVWERLLYRHWDEWRAGKRSHVFAISAGGGAPIDLTPFDADAPTLALGGYHDIAVTSDSREVAFVRNSDRQPATGTNNDIYIVPIEGGAARNLTRDNLANDNNPLFSPDGRWMAYRAQVRPGFESDRMHLMLYDRATQTSRDLTAEWPLSVGEMVWAADSQLLYALVQEKTRSVLYEFSISSGQPRKVSAEGHYRSLRIGGKGKTLVFTGEDSAHPAEVFRLDLSSRLVHRLSHVNDKVVSGVAMNLVEEFWFRGAKGDKIEGLLLKPPFFRPSERYPLVYLIHGGPQGAWQDSFHPRWNYQMFAAPGYVVAMVNFHGSTGYGQDFTDSISRHWGDYPYEDLMKGLDFILQNFAFVDNRRVAAAGASYGGYMINWIATHTDRFNCLVNHDGLFNVESMYGETEELWFPEWEFGGTPWENRALYRKWSPHTSAANLKTPMLVIHGQLDYRVDVSQGFETFTALRRRNVPARFLYFPDEGHWVLKPRNRRLWWNEVLGWLDQYLRPQGQ
ncbi:MAG: prolyl oligopeptidase family serine peptidase [Acidobacteriota bacterium]